MSDKYVNLAELKNALLSYTWRDEDDNSIDDADEKAKYIEGWLPNIPVVELIRCRDGKYYQSTHINGEAYAACIYHILTRQRREPTDFCSNAQKREAEE